MYIKVYPSRNWVERLKGFGDLLGGRREKIEDERGLGKGETLPRLTSEKFRQENMALVQLHSHKQFGDGDSGKNTHHQGWPCIQSW